MGAKDTVIRECICGGYDFTPFYSPWDVNNTKLNHCYECDAYHKGRQDQAEISFKAGIAEEKKRCTKDSKRIHKAGIREVVEWVSGNIIWGYPNDCIMDWQAKLKEWGIENVKIK